MDFGITGMRFVVTGGGMGIGAATARMVVAQGGHVVVADVNESAGKAVVDELVDGPGSACFVSCDVADPGQISNLMVQSAEAMGGIDVLHNNAGISDAMSTTDLDVEHYPLEVWNRIIAVNLTAPFLATQAALPYLKQSSNPSIINVASIASFLARPNTLAYTTTKTGVAGLTRQLALDLAQYGIRVNSYGPGMVETPMALGYLNASTDPAGTKASILDNYLSDDLGHPDQVAALVCYLASEAARFINGVVWPIDGGFTAWKATPTEVRNARK